MSWFIFAFTLALRPALAWAISWSMCLSTGLVQGERRLQHLVQRPGAPQGRELLEHALHVEHQLVVAGEQAVVRVLAGRAGMVVARSQMRVAAQPLAFAANHQRHLGVGLVADDAVHHLGAGFLQLVGEFDVGRFVEAGAQLDHHQHVLAGQRRRRAAPSPPRNRRRCGTGVWRIRQHVRVRRRPLQEVKHRRERVEGVVQQDVARRGSPRRRPPRRGCAAAPGA